MRSRRKALQNCTLMTNLDTHTHWAQHTRTRTHTHTRTGHKGRSVAGRECRRKWEVHT